MIVFIEVSFYLLLLIFFINLPVMMPANIVPKKGVLNLGCTFPKLLNIRPSLDIAYKILGSGYIEPNMLQKSFFLDFSSS